jgi:hypothetical protein
MTTWVHSSDLVEHGIENSSVPRSIRGGPTKVLENVFESNEALGGWYAPAGGFLQQ